MDIMFIYRIHFLSSYFQVKFQCCFASFMMYIFQVQQAMGRRRGLYVIILDIDECGM